MGIMDTEQIDFGNDDPSEFPEGWTTANDADLDAVNAAISESSQPSEDAVPLMEEPPENVVLLPGGLVHDNEVYREAVVRELNGEDEEYLARAMMGDNAVRYIQTLLERGVEAIGPVKVDNKVLDRLLIGDRDALFLGIRRATYGDDLDVSISCPSCLITADVKVDLKTEIPVRPLAWPVYEEYQEVVLPKTGTAVIRLANGGDWRFLNGLENKTMPERNTILLARCVKTLNGLAVTASTIKSLSMKDRRTLIDWMADNQPGPEYDKVIWTCDACAKEVPVSINPAELFPG